MAYRVNKEIKYNIQLICSDGSKLVLREYVLSKQRALERLETVSKSLPNVIKAQLLNDGKLIKESQGACDF